MKNPPRRRVRRARNRLIRWLAHGDAIMLNTVMSCTDGWWVASQTEPADAYVADNDFWMDGRDAPDSVLLRLVERPAL